MLSILSLMSQLVSSSAKDYLSLRLRTFNYTLQWHIGSFVAPDHWPSGSVSVPGPVVCGFDHQKKKKGSENVELFKVNFKWL